MNGKRLTELGLKREAKPRNRTGLEDIKRNVNLSSYKCVSISRTFAQI